MSMQKLFDMEDKVTIITGAGQGLGKEMALAIADAGSNIVIAQRNMKTAGEAKVEIEALGVKCLTIKMDVTKPDEVNEMVSTVLKEFGKIDVLFNNSGVCILGDAESMPLDDWNTVINTNLNGCFIVSQAVGRVMLKQGKGNIVNVASMSGMIVNTPQNQCSYNTSKGGIIMLTKSMAAEWAQKGVRVNALCPGYMRTEMSEEHYRSNDPMIDKWFSMTPMGRSGVPSELRGIAVFLASDASSYATGSTFLIDGGYTAW